MLELVKKNEPEKDKKVEEPISTGNAKFDKLYNESIDFLRPLKDDPRFNTLTYWENKAKELKSIARRELVQIQNSKDVSEGKKRLYDKAAEAFQVFIDAEDIRADSKEMRYIAYGLLIYYIDKFYPDIEVELDAEGQVLLLDQNPDPSDKSVKLLIYFMRSWVETHHLGVISFDIMSSIYSDF